MSREEQIAPSHLAVLRVAVNVVPACVLSEFGVFYVESPPYQAFREVFKLAVVDVSVGSDGEQARRQLIPLDQGAPGVQSGEEELHQRCFLTAENVTLFTSCTLNLDRALSVTLFCLSSTVFGVWVISSRLQFDLVASRSHTGPSSSLSPLGCVSFRWT